MAQTTANPSGKSYSGCFQFKEHTPNHPHQQESLHQGQQEKAYHFVQPGFLVFMELTMTVSHLLYYLRYIVCLSLAKPDLQGFLCCKTDNFFSVYHLFGQDGIPARFSAVARIRERI